MIRHVNSLRWIYRQIKATKGKIPLLESARNGPTIKRLKSIQDGYSGPNTDKVTKNMNFHTDIMRHKCALCIHVTLPPYTQLRVKVMKSIDLIYTEPKHYQWTGRRVCKACGIHKVVPNKQFEILWTNFSAVECKFVKGVVISYATSIPVIRYSSSR